MYKYILETAGQIDWMAIMPLLIFFSFFMITLIITMRKKKSFIDKMKYLPFETD